MLLLPFTGCPMYARAITAPAPMPPLGAMAAMSVMAKASKHTCCRITAWSLAALCAPKRMKACLKARKMYAPNTASSALTSQQRELSGSWTPTHHAVSGRCWNSMHAFIQAPGFGATHHAQVRVQTERCYGVRCVWEEHAVAHVTVFLTRSGASTCVRLTARALLVHGRRRRSGSVRLKGL